VKKTLIAFGAIISILIVSGFVFGHMSGDMGYGGMRNSGMIGSCMMSGHGMKGHGMMGNHSECPMIDGGSGNIDYYLSYKGELSLSNTQVKSLESIRDAYQKENIKKRAELESAQLEFDNLLDEENINLAKVKSLNKKVSDLMADLRYSNIESAVKAQQVLSKDQFSQLEKVRAERQYRGKGETPCGMHR